MIFNEDHLHRGSLVQAAYAYVDNRAGKHAPSLSELTCRDTLPVVLHLGQDYATVRG